MNEISTDEIVSLRRSGEAHVLLDCRGNDYFRHERIPGAVNLRWKQVPSGATTVLPDKDGLIVTYCQSFACSASTKGYEALVELGYRRVREYSGGIEDWKAHGNPVEWDSAHRLNQDTYRFPGQRFYGSEVGCYLIDTDEKVVLLDPPQLLTEEHEDFIADFGKPIVALLTHDATGGAADQLRRRYGAEVLLHLADKGGRWISVEPSSYFAEEFDLTPSLRVLHTPGHTQGSVCLYDRRHKSLFSGDTLYARSGVLEISETDDLSRRDREALVASVRRLVGLEVDAIYPFHYEMLRTGVREQLGRLEKEQR